MSHSKRFSSPSAVGSHLAVSSVELIIENISSAITTGKLNVGEKLPSEQELAAQFGVAVVTLRKALEELREREIVKTVRGRSGGTFIVRLPQATLAELQQQLLQTSLAALRDFFDEHSAVSGMAARLAAERISTGRAWRLQELMHEARDAKEQRDRAVADARFHFKVATLSHSHRLLQAEQRLYSELTPTLWKEGLTGADPLVAHQEHQAIFDAIEAHDPDAAATAAITHVRSNQDLVIGAKLALHKQYPDGVVQGAAVSNVGFAGIAALGSQGKAGS